MKLISSRLPLIVLLLVWLAPHANARNNSDYTQFGHDIHIGPTQATNELTCFGCSIYVRGQVAGDVTAMGGRVVIEGDGSVGGEITTILGDVRLDKGAKVGGDVSAIGGKVMRQPEAIVGGDVTSLEGTTWIWLIVGFPILLFAGIIALIVWLVQRNRTPAPSMARVA